jgi:hypothetical protein
MIDYPNQIAASALNTIHACCSRIAAAPCWLQLTHEVQSAMMDSVPSLVRGQVSGGIRNLVERQVWIQFGGRVDYGIVSHYLEK